MTSQERHDRRIMREIEEARIKRIREDEERAKRNNSCIDGPSIRCEHCNKQDKCLERPSYYVDRR